MELLAAEEVADPQDSITGPSPTLRTTLMTVLMTPPTRLQEMAVLIGTSSAPSPALLAVIYMDIKKKSITEDHVSSAGVWSSMMTSLGMGLS